MILGEEGPHQSGWFQIFEGAPRRLHFRAPTAHEWDQHHLAHMASVGDFRSAVEPEAINHAAIYKADIAGALALLTGLEIDGEVPVEGDWRDEVSGGAGYRPVLRVVAQEAFLRATRKASPRPEAGGGAAGVPEHAGE